MKRVFGLLVAVTLLLTGVFSANYVLLQRHLNNIIESDFRNEGISIRSHYGLYVNSKILVFDLLAISSQNAPADIFRVLLQYSEALQDRTFDKIVLEYDGTPKFYLLGDFFQETGIEYGVQNAVYTMRTFPENVYEMDGTHAFGTWTGGLLGVATRQLDDFSEFHKRWYVTEMLNN